MMICEQFDHCHVKISNCGMMMILLLMICEQFDHCHVTMSNCGMMTRAMMMLLMI